MMMLQLMNLRDVLNSIRTGDPKKFKRVINKIIESKR